MAPDARPLAPEDLAILALESSTIAGHVCKVITLDAPGVTLEALLERLAQRIDRTPVLTCRLSASTGDHSWVPDPHFDLRNHVVRLAVEAPVDRNGLLERVASVFEQHLDRARPLWSLVVVDLDGGGTALVWRIHHALADGTTSNRIASLLLWDEAPDEAPAEHLVAKEREVDDARRRVHLAGFIRREFARQRSRSPFDGIIGLRRELGLATTSLVALHQAAHSVDGATVNDAVLTVVAGALRRWLVALHRHLADVRVRVPVSLHHEGDDAANRDSYFSLVLPVHDADPLERLRAVHHATSLRKAADDAQELDSVYRRLSVFSPHLRHLAAKLEDSPRRFALSISNVPGPRSPMTLLGAAVSGLFDFAEIGEHHAMRIAAVSNVDRLCLGICADPELVPGVQTIALAAEAEAEALVSAAGRA